MKSTLIMLSIFAVTLFSIGASADATAAYAGKFEGRSGTLNLMSAEGAYSLSFAGADGSNDLIGRGCETQIGASTSVKVKDGVLKKIEFKFTSNCDVAGRELVAEFKKNTVRLSVYQGEKVVPICQWDQWGRQYCRNQYFANYLTGKFSN